MDALESLTLKNLITNKDSDDKAIHDKQWMPDIYSYDSESEDQKHPTHPDGSGKEPSPLLTHMTQLLPFKLKHGKHDPFSDNPDGPGAPFEATHVETQGQIAAILNKMFSCSFRTHTFMIFMDDHIARLFRADRAGVLVSEAFSYRTQATYLIEFLHRFDSMTPGERGVDTTVDRDHKKIQVPINSNSSLHTIVELEGILPHTKSLVSRARRVVKVQDQDHKHYIMKDGWRSDLRGMVEEWQIVAELKEKGVPRIPAIVSGGHVPGKYHRTLADTYAERGWRVGPKTKLTPRVHYRFIEEDAGKPLEEFSNAKELSCVLKDVIEILQVAWDRCQYVHRDVSSANILITPGGRGVLIDWEFAREVPVEPRICTRTSGCVGTWAYMSAALLKYPKKCHSPLDDLQSIYWVAFTNGLNYLNHTYPNMVGAARCLTEYDPMTKQGGIHKGDHLHGPLFIEFVGNLAFSRLLYDFCQMMDSADSWEVKLAQFEDPTMAGPRPANIPDHNAVLRIFDGALDCPDNHWSVERNYNRRLLEATKPVNFFAADSLTCSQSPGSQKYSWAPGGTSEAGEAW